MLKCEYDAFEHICGAAFDTKRKGLVAWVVPMNDYYEAYFDATGSAQKGQLPVHTVAVYLAKQDDWRKMRKEWNRELRGVPYFHMTDFEHDFLATKKGEPISRKSPFNGLKEDEFLPLLQRLHKTIARKGKNGKPRINGIASHLVKSAFDQLRPKELKNDPWCASYYIFNVGILLKDIRIWSIKNNINEPVHYIFAGGDKEGNNLEALFTDLFDDPAKAKLFPLNKGFNRLGYGIAWMKKEPAIQAADIGCYELHKNIETWIQMDYPDYIPAQSPLRRKSLSFLASMGMEHRGWAYRGQQLRDEFNGRLRELRGK